MYKKISDINETTEVIIPCLITKVEAKVTKQDPPSPYCQITATDGVEDITANYFNLRYKTTEEAEGMAKNFPGHVAELTMIKNGQYNDICNVELADGKYDKSEFILTAPIPSEQMYDEIIAMLNALENPLKKVAIYFYSQHKSDLLKWAGGLKMHHAMVGGLLYHVYRMAKTADVICGVYTDLKHDLLVLGTVLHDIGKLVEFITDDNGAVEYTKEGVLMGHLHLGANMFLKAVKEVEELEEIKFDTEQVELVEHMILSHHEKKEWDAVRTPATYEAYVLARIDYFDSHAFVYEDELPKIEPGEFSDANYKIDKNRIYRPLI